MGCRVDRGSALSSLRHRRARAPRAGAPRRPPCRRACCRRRAAADGFRAPPPCRARDARASSTRRAAGTTRAAVASFLLLRRQKPREDCGRALPFARFFLELPASGPREAVELCLAVVLRHAPHGIDVPLLLEL